MPNACRHHSHRGFENRASASQALSYTYIANKAGPKAHSYIYRQLSLSELGAFLYIYRQQS
jgi:hypothetical protein